MAASSDSINDAVRRKIRELRKAKAIKVREIAARTGMPYSSYASMESGFYKINLDNLFIILGALDVDIREVWPAETLAGEVANESLFLQRVQQFRLGEIVSLSEAEGGAFFALKNCKCRVLLHQGVSDFLLDRLILYLEDDVFYTEGLWYRKKLDETIFYFFLKRQNCPDFVEKLLKKYLAIWAEVYRAI